MRNKLLTTAIDSATACVLAGVLGFALVGVVSTPEPSEAASTMQQIEITASNGKLQTTAGQVRPGWTKVTLINTDTDSHQAALIRLPKSVSAANFLTQFATEGEKALVTTVASGGPAVAFPKGSSSVFVKLEAGTYIAADMVPGPDGKPKATKGFVTSFEVTSGLGGASATRPRADSTVKLHDFFFAGKLKLKQGSTVAIYNDGAQPHEMVMFGLAPGKTAKDVAEFLLNPAPTGPPPFVSALGISGIAPKATGYLTVEAPVGKYAFVCFLPDVRGKGEPHVLKGMMGEGEVTA